MFLGAMWESGIFANTLTPKFYVALTGTSSLISGLILIFEWWYFRKYGTSFIEQISINHLGPWLVAIGVAGPADPDAATGNNSSPGAGTNCNSNSSHNTGASGALGGECKVWRNPTNLLRGAEYQRFYRATGREPLTAYDMNLTAQEQRALFTCDGEADGDEASPLSLAARAWRARSGAARAEAARRALRAAEADDADADGAAGALLLLAEEDAATVQEAERLLRRAARAAEAAARRSAAAAAGAGAGAAGAAQQARARRDAAVLAHVRRRLAMCARRLGRLREATRAFRELTREAPPALAALSTHENLIEALLEQNAVADVQAVLARYDDIGLPKSATVCYTAALLRARAAAAAALAAAAPGAGAGAAAAAAGAEAAAAEAIHRAVEFNPHVPEYLLELRPLAPPPEHVLKRGDSEAVAYAFAHLAHWKAARGARRLLAGAWRGAFRALPAPLERGHLFHPYPACTECADRELLPAPHRVSVYPRRAPPPLLPLTAALCALAAAAAAAACRWPDAAAAARAFLPRVPPARVSAAGGAP